MKLGAPTAFPSGLVVILHAPYPASNLFLLFIPRGQWMFSTGPQQIACSAGSVWG